MAVACVRNACEMPTRLLEQASAALEEVGLLSADDRIR